MPAAVHHRVSGLVQLAPRCTVHRVCSENHLDPRVPVDLLRSHRPRKSLTKREEVSHSGRVLLNFQLFAAQRAELQLQMHRWLELSSLYLLRYGIFQPPNLHCSSLYPIAVTCYSFVELITLFRLNGIEFVEKSARLHKTKLKIFHNCF